MKLRLKVLVILAGMWALILSAIFFYSQSTLTNEYAKLERHQVAEDLNRTNKTLDSLFSSLKLLNLDWSQWDDAYHFVKNKNPAFIKANMAFTTFENSKINLIMFFNSSGKLIYGLNYDLHAKKFIPIPEDVLAYIGSEKSYSRQRNMNSSKMGILKAKDGYVVLSSLPILTSQGKGPIAGTLIMGYFLTDRHLEQLSNIVNLSVHIFPLPIPDNNAELQLVYANLQNGQPDYIAVQNEKTIAGYTFIRDIDRNPIGMLRIQVPRIFFSEGMKTIERYQIILVCLGVIFLIAVWYLLKFFVLDRVIKVDKEVMDITSNCSFAKRISASGKDELANLIKSINSLVEIVQLTEEQLKYRIYLRTEELERLSKLNKNLYTEMSNQRIVETKLREDEKLLKHMAYFDVLTGLPNRLFLHEHLDKMLAQAEQTGTGLVVMFLDADKFKSINDTYGHDIGDKFLQHAAQQIKATIKDTDIAARLAGDEFVVCLSNLRGKQLISHVAEKILQQVTTPLVIGDLTISSTFSIGISMYPEDGRTASELERHADIAMYYAKKNTENSYCFYDETIKTVST